MLQTGFQAVVPGPRQRSTGFRKYSDDVPKRVFSEMTGTAPLGWMLLTGFFAGNRKTPKKAFNDMADSGFLDGLLTASGPLIG